MNLLTSEKRVVKKSWKHYKDQQKTSSQEVVEALQRTSVEDECDLEFF